MDGRLSRGLIASAFLLASPGLAKADAVNAEWYSPTRALSTGNIGIASADDAEEAAFYNPAALARMKKTIVEPFDPQVEFGQGFFSNSGSIMDWAKAGNYSKLQPNLKSHPGSATSEGIALFPNVTSQNFSFGILAGAKSAAYFNSGESAFHYQSRRYLIPSLGLSVGTFGGKIKAGVAVRGVQLSETTLQNPTGGSTTANVSNSRDGFGVALDSGLLFTIPSAGLPTIGLVVRNIGGTAFTSPQFLPIGGRSNTRHEIIHQSYDAGLSFTPKMGKGNSLKFATDFRDATNTTGVNMIRHVNLGLEYGLSKFFFMRAGFSQGYWTAGFGLDAKTGGIDLGTYSEELSSSSYHGTGDRRYTMRLTRRF